MEASEKNHVLFIQLILMFHSAAMQYMGKIKNPATDKVERDLPQAQVSIDMLEMLKTKTQNNLDDEEKKLIDALLRELRLNFVDEVNKDKQKSKEEPAQPSGTE